MNMAMVRRPRQEKTPGRGIPEAAPNRPEWAQGLRQIYDSVLHEPLPDSVSALLRRLDKGPN
jgi:Anti-sigma factor NepR